MSTTQNFRSAFNGFNREAVVNYISFMTTKHETQLNQLQTDLAQARQDLEERQDVDLVSELEVSDLRQQLEEKDELIAELQAKLAEKDEQIAQMEERTAAPVEAVAAPSLAEQELTAYRRAESAERRAMERVGQMYAEANGILAQTISDLDQNASVVDQITEQVRADLERLEKAVSQSKAILTDSAVMVAAIRPEK